MDSSERIVTSSICAEFSVSSVIYPDKSAVSSLICYSPMPIHKSMDLRIYYPVLPLVCHLRDKNCLVADPTPRLLKNARFESYHILRNDSLKY